SIDRRLETAKPGPRVVARADRHEHRHAQIQKLGIQQGNLALDVASLLEQADAAPARGGGQSHASGELADGQLGIVLQLVENATVVVIKSARPGHASLRNVDHRILAATKKIFQYCPKCGTS